MGKIGVVHIPSAMFETTYERHTIAHEFLHGYGDKNVGHNEVLECNGDAAYRPSIILYSPDPECNRLGGVRMNIMGSTWPFNDITDFDVSGSSKVYYDWLPSDAVRVVTTSGDYDMHALEGPLQDGTLYLLKIPVPGIAVQNYVLEFRRDANNALNPEDRKTPGVYAYIVEQYEGNSPSQFVLKTYEAEDNRHGLGPLQSSHTTLQEGLDVRVISTSGTHARVEVLFR